MSGAGRGVTPGAEPDNESGTSAPAASETGQGPDVPGQGGPGSRDGASASGARTSATGASADGESASSGPEAAGAQASARRPGRRPRKKRSFWREFPILVVIALVLAVVIKTYAIQAFFIPSGSMENTLEINDRVLVNKLVYDVRGIHRGDIVVFNGDGSWDPGPAPANANFVQKFASGFASMFGFGHPGDILIKRVIGLPGDHVACCDAAGRVTVNGVPLTEQSYLYPGDSPSEIRFNIVVPTGRLWVMGDHRLISDDSRDHLGDPGGGTVPENAVIGRAFVIIWPPSRWRILPIPGTFEQPKLSASAADPRTAPAQDGDVLLSARLEPSSPALPLALGFVAAVPVTWLQRRVRRGSPGGARPSAGPIGSTAPATWSPGPRNPCNWRTLRIVMTRDPGAPAASNLASPATLTSGAPSGSAAYFRNMYPRYPGYTPRRDGGLGAYETVLARAGFAPVAGIDEAGRGACAGPLVVAAVVLDPASIRRMPGLADSKLLTPQAREEAYTEILRRAIDWHVIVIGADQIDATGLHVCNVSGMRRAFAGLRASPGYVLTDGFPVRGLGVPGLAVWKGDRVTASVAAASIVAKVSRDRMMRDLHERYPLYGFDRHKGYVTDEHVRTLAEHGPSPVHRYSFVNVTRAAALTNPVDPLAPMDAAGLMGPAELAGISPAGALGQNERRMDA